MCLMTRHPHHQEQLRTQRKFSACQNICIEEGGVSIKNFTANIMFTVLSLTSSVRLQSLMVPGGRGKKITRSSVGFALLAWVKKLEEGGRWPLRAGAARFLS